MKNSLLHALLGGTLLLTSGVAHAQTPTVRYTFAGTALDQSGNGRHGTLLGAASVGAATLNIPEDATSRVRLPEAAINGLNDFSVAAFVTITPLHTSPGLSLQLNTVLSGATAVEDNVIQLAWRPQNATWQVYIGSPMIGNPTQSFSPPVPQRPVAGQWVHIAYVRSTSMGITTGTFYQNGVQIGATINLMGQPLSLATLNVDPNGLVIGQDQDAVDGGYDPLQSLKGQVGELTIYNGGLTAAQVATLARTAWTGDQSTDWASANNWSRLAAPTATTDAVVAAGVPNQPIISGAATVRNLLLESGSALSQAAAGSLNLKGTFTNNSFSTSLAGTTSFSAAGAQSILGTAKANFTNLTVGAGGVVDGGAGVTVSRLLTLTGNLTPGEAPLVLASTATGTAMVINNGGVVSGPAAVQCFITPGTVPGLGYRHMASPVVAATVSDLNTSVYTAVVNPLYNTAPNPLLVAPYPNLFYFDEALTASSFSKGYQSPANLGAVMTPGLGYSVYMKPSTNAASTPDFVGTLNNGPINSEPLSNGAGSGSSGWHLLGNPYPAPLNWNLVRAIPGAIPAGMDDAVSVLKTTGGANGVYLSYVNGVGNLPGGLIAAGQAFFVHNSIAATAPVFQFTNAMRATTYANPTHFRPAADARPLLALALTNLADDATDETFVYAEEGATRAFEGRYDAIKAGRSLATAPTLAVATAGQDLAICGLAPADLTAGLELPLRVFTNTAGRHELRASALRGLPANQPLWLIDALTGLVTDLSAPGARVVFVQAPTFAGSRFGLRIGGARPVTAAVATPTLDAYPNPTAATGELSISVRGLAVADATVMATLTDAVGRVVRRATVAALDGAATFALPVAGLPAGIYQLRANSPASPATGSAQTIVVQ